ncbi:P-loop containing nucleoside triphosphate hydrolase protein [Acephala macrosclerotiorum]|nr:P-loop containing nucleoside triphosphate hydrolase protein [Acephala macrosclerotiorum]
MPPEAPVQLVRKTTSGVNVFDAWQFKRLVDKDVSVDVIKQLQKDCGDDLTLAVDKFHELEAKAKISSPVQEKETNGIGENGEQEETKTICYRDQYWDKSKRKWVLKRTAKGSSGIKKLGRYVLFVRRVYTEKMTYSHTVIIVKGAILRNALCNIFRGADGFILTDDENVEIENIHFLFWAKPELELLAEHYQSVGNAQGLFEINAGLQFIQEEWSTTISALDSMLPHSMSFDYLWAILPPDCLVIGKDMLERPSVWRIRSHAVSRQQDGSMIMTLKAESLDWNGKRLGIAERPLVIRAFTGSMSLEDLPYVPLRFHSGAKSIMEKILRRSQRKLEFCRSGFKVQEHEGRGITEIDEKLALCNFHGRVIIDPKMLTRVQPMSSLVPNLKKFRDASRACVNEFTTSKQEVLDDLLKDQSQNAAGNASANEAGGLNSRHRRYSFSSDSETGTDTDSDNDLLPHDNGKAKEHSITQNLSAEQQLLLSGFVYGYCLGDATWGAFGVDRVSDVEWKESIFGDVVMDPNLKEIIFRLIKAHGSQISDFDDFVKGKGKGLIGLLHGPPGSGKTLTAEAIAETAHMPLYMVSSGSLGHEADDIYDSLKRIFELTTHWKAVLLLDEADVFLSRRSLSDLKRNAIVSVFLQELEYYQGIMLLTTNLAQNIDEAFQSRIHFCHHYPILDFSARQKIWESFIEKARSTESVKVDIGPSGIDQLAKLELNGRQIKNATSIAIKLGSSSDSYTITADSIIATAKSLQNFNFENTRPVSKGRGYVEHDVSLPAKPQVPLKPKPIIRSPSPGNRRT